MKKLHIFLRLLLFSNIGVFIGRTAFQCWDYYQNPDLYEMAFAPWHLSIQINGLFTAIIFVIILVIVRLVKRRIKERINDSAGSTINT